MSTQRLLRSMSLEEKVAQTIFPAVRPLWPAGGCIEGLVRGPGVGGILLREGGLLDAVAMIGHLQGEARIPLIVAADMERGIGERLAGGTVFPSNMALAAAGDESAILAQGKVAAAEAAFAGVHLVLAPVLDVHGRFQSPIVGTRSYGADPREVGRLGAAFIRGCSEGGVGTCAKHFPGHGEAIEDSHAVLPTVERGISELQSHELVPFASAIDAGVDAVMVGHIRLPAIDGSDGPPASLSGRVIRSLLREEMGFDGLVMTDALLMGGITTVLTEEEGAVGALAAGADILLCPTEPRAIHGAVLRAVEDGEVPEGRLEEAVGRILRWKEKRGLLGGATPPAGGVSLGEAELEEHRAAARAAAEGSICLLRNDRGAIPIRKGAPVLAVVVPDRFDPFAATALLDGLSRRAPTTVHHLLPGWGESDRGRVATLAAGAGSVIWAALGRPSAWLSPESPPRLDPLPAERTIALALGAPSLLDRSPASSASVCAFSDAEVSQEAAVRALFGEIPFRGRLPIDCGAGRRGDGLLLHQDAERAG